MSKVIFFSEKSDFFAKKKTYPNAPIIYFQIPQSSKYAPQNLKEMGKNHQDTFK